MQGALLKLYRVALAAIGAFYILAGLFLMLYSADPLGLGLTLRLMLGTVLLAYGGFRVVRGLRHTGQV